MSMFSIPDELMPSGAMLDEMMKETKALMPAEFAGTVNLLAHPLAGMAAMSALGLGFASHAAGVWFGALTGATVASQRLLSSAFDDYAASADEFRDTSRSPRTRAKAAASVLIAEASAAAPAQEPVTPKPVAGKAAKVLRIVETQPKADAVPEAGPKLTKTVSRKTAKPAVSTPDVSPIVEPTGKAEPQPANVEPVVEEAAPLAAEAPEIVVAPVPAETAAVVSETASVPPEAAPAVTEAPPLAAEFSLVSPRKPAAIDKPEMPDDLKAISGVGPKLEQVLNGLGVWTYAQVAAWGSDEIAWVDDTLGFKGRIERDGWIGQAAALAAAKG